MFALALKLWRFLLTIELDRIDEEDTSTKDKDEDQDIIPARKFIIGFAPDEEDDEEDDEEGEDLE
jgi:hypothetical protein